MVLADFGSAAKCGRAVPVVVPACIEDMSHVWEVGTPLYLPPEAVRRRDYRVLYHVFNGAGGLGIAGQGLAGTAGDVWSCGVVA